MYWAEKGQSDGSHGSSCELHQWVAAQTGLWDAPWLVEAQPQIQAYPGAAWTREGEGGCEREGEREGEIWISFARVRGFLNAVKKQKHSGFKVWKTGPVTVLTRCKLLMASLLVNQLRRGTLDFVDCTGYRFRSSCILPFKSLVSIRYFWKTLIHLFSTFISNKSSSF